MKITTIYLYSFICANFFSLIFTLVSGKYNGDLKLFKASQDSFALIGTFIFIFLGYLITFKALDKSILKKSVKKLEPNKKWMDYLIFFMIILYIFLYIKFGYGKAGVTVRLRGLTAVMMLLPLNEFFLLYHCFRGQRRSYYFNLILYIALSLIQGWSGSLIILILLEFIIRNKNKLNKNKLKITIKVLILSYLYKYLLMFKQMIRGKVQEITYIDGLDHILGRISQFPNISFIVGNRNSIMSSVKNEIGNFFYVKEFFINFLPKSSLGLSNFRNVNAILGVDYLGRSQGTSVLTGVLGKAILMNYYEVFVYIIFLVLLIFSYVKISKLFGSENLNYLVYLQVLFLFLSGNYNVFSKIYFALIIFAIYTLLINSIFKRRY